MREYNAHVYNLFLYPGGGFSQGAGTEVVLTTDVDMSVTGKL